MIRKFFVLCLIVSGTLMTSLGAQTNVVKWQQSPIGIDGIADDWGATIRFFNSESRIHYEFRNDDKNVYIILKTNDEQMKRQLLMAGMKLKFKVKTEPKTYASINFPSMIEGRKPMPPGVKDGKQGMGKGAPKAQTQQNDQEMPMDEDMDMLPEMNHKDTLQTEGFQFADKIISDNIFPGEICFAKTKDMRAKDMVYELAIPIREFAGKDYELSSLSDVQFQVQIIVNSMSSSSSGGRGGMSGRMSGGMGGPGGGMGGGMGGPGGGMGGGPGGDMGGGGPGGDMGGGPEGGMDEGSSMTRKTINAQFYLSVKPQ